MSLVSASGPGKITELLLLAKQTKNVRRELTYPRHPLPAWGERRFTSWNVGKLLPTLSICSYQTMTT